MNPVIKFTTLFGLLAVELAIELNRTTSAVLALVFFVVGCFFVWRSFYGMRIESPGGSITRKQVHAQGATV